MSEESNNFLEIRKSFVRGYVCAISNLYSNTGDYQEVVSLMESIPITIDDAKQSQCLPYDIENLEECFIKAKGGKP